MEVPSAWIECTYDVDVGPLTHRYPGYQKHRWIVLHEDEFGALGCLPGWSRKQRRTLRSTRRRLEESGNVTVQRLADQEPYAEVFGV